NAVRATYREELIALMSARTEARTVADLLAALERAGVACAPIRDARAVAGDAYLDHAGMFVHEFAADLGELPLINFPLVVDGERAQTMQPPPALGEHTDDILAALGYQPGEISKLRAQGLVG
ncbi:MAG TPA: CoA transferase, partial [Rhodocyclaceae bacterium]|nr:CoA transferase [Rhodocyclaceae bacterium]